MRREALEFHIDRNDYFGNLATVLDLVRQDLHRRGYERHAETLAGLCNDLLYLQRRCRIENIESAAEDSG